VSELISKPHKGSIGPLGLSIHERKIFTKLSGVMKQGENLNFNWQSGGRK
jgi:hypothetical protein